MRSSHMQCICICIYMNMCITGGACQRVRPSIYICRSCAHRPARVGLCEHVRPDVRPVAFRYEHVLVRCMPRRPPRLAEPPASVASERGADPLILMVETYSFAIHIAREVTAIAACPSRVQTPNTNGCRPLILFFRRAHRIPVPRRSTSGGRPLRAVTVLCPTSKGVCSGPPPRLAVGGLARRKEHGLTLTLTDVYYVTPMCPSGEHGRGYHPAPGGFASREKRDRGHTNTRTRISRHSSSL